MKSRHKHRLLPQKKLHSTGPHLLALQATRRRFSQTLRLDLNFEQLNR